MPIQTQCEHCGFAYVSKDEMIGKKVRCRNCGQVFSVGTPSETFEEPSAELPPEAGYEGGIPPVTMEESNMSGGIGSAKSRMERVGDPGTFDFDNQPPADLARPATPFYFPYSGLLDEWGPRLLTLAMLGWFAYIMYTWRGYREDLTNPDWAGIIPISLALLAFLAVWIPVFAGAIRQVSRAMKFHLPANTVIRHSAVASLPFALGGLFWIAGESTVTLGIGVLLGTAIAIPVAWFVYRLRDMEIAHGAIAIALASLVSAGITAGLFAGTSYITTQAMVSAGNADTFEYSPFGPGFEWPAPPDAPSSPFQAVRPGTPAQTRRPAPPAPRPEWDGTATDPPIASQVITPGNGTSTATSPPQTGTTPRTPPQQTQAPADPTPDPFANHRVLTDGRYLDLPSGAQVVYPLLGPADAEGRIAPINHIAVVTNSPGGQDVSVYRINPFRRVHEPQPFASTIGGYALSPDGDLLARVTRFGGSTIQIWSYSQQRIVARVQPDQDPQLIGFLNNNTLLCAWRNVPPNAMEVAAVDLSSQKWTDYILSRDTHGALLAPIWDGDRFSVLATATAQRDNVRSLRIYPPLPSTRQTIIPILRRDAAAELTPSAIAPSPDGTQIAVAYEQEGQLQIVIYRRPDRPGATNVDLIVRNHIFPGGLGLANAGAGAPSVGPAGIATEPRFTWMPSDQAPGSEEVAGILFYKQLAINPDNGRIIDRNETAPQFHKAIDADTIHFVLPSGPRILEGKLRR